MNAIELANIAQVPAYVVVARAIAAGLDVTDDGYVQAPIALVARLFPRTPLAAYTVQATATRLARKRNRPYASPLGVPNRVAYYPQTTNKCYIDAIRGAI